MWIEMTREIAKTTYESVSAYANEESLGLTLRAFAAR
jgi:hypothetical protein